MSQQVNAAGLAPFVGRSQPPGENPLKLSNHQFLKTIIGPDEWTKALVTSFPEDPSSAGGGSWSAGTADDRLSRMNPNENQYFAISLFRENEAGVLRRRKDLHESTHCVVIDDVGDGPSAKVNPEALLLPPPSWRLCTSPGNEQWGYILTTPATDPNRVSGLLCGLVERGIAKNGRDPGMTGVTRYVRLPGGSNMKSKYNNGDAGFKCLLKSWRPDLTYTLEQLADPYSIDLSSFVDEKRNYPQPVSLEDDPVVEFLKKTGRHLGESNGEHHFRCFWIDEHTDRAESGASYRSPGLFNCHHRCTTRSNSEWWAELGRLSLETLNRLSNLVSNRSHLDDAVQSVVPGAGESSNNSQNLKGSPNNRGTSGANKSSSGTGALDIVTLGELYTEPEQDVRWLLDNRLGSGGVSVIGGNPKAGKSTFARALSIAVARGEPFLGWATSQGPVFYAALEERRPEVRRHYHELGAAANDPIYVIFGHNERDLLEKIRVAAAELNPVLLVIDTMQRLFHLEDLNNYAEVSAKFNPLFEFANETGCHIAILHHTKKGRRKRSSSGEDLLGSQAIEASVDCTILINRDGPDRTIETIQRIGPDLEKCALTLDPETGWPQIAGTLKAISERAIEKQILSILESSGRISQADLLKEIKGTDAKIRPILARVVEEGKVLKSGEGKRGNPLFYEKPSNSEFPVSAFPDSISEEENKYRNEGDEDVSPSGFPVPREKLETGNAQGEDRESSPSDAQTAGDRDCIGAGVPDRDEE